MFRGAREFLHCNTDGRLDNCTHIAYKPRSRRALARPGFFSDLLRPCASDTTPAAPIHKGAAPAPIIKFESDVFWFVLSRLAGAARAGSAKIIKFESGIFCFPFRRGPPCGQNH